MRSLPILAIIPLLGQAADYPRPTGYVNDFANQLAPADRDALESKLRAYQQATSNRVALAIVPSLEGESVARYANGLFHAWGIGEKGKDNGVLFLWAPQERKVKIEVGYGLASTLTDSAAAEVVSEVTSFFRRGEFTQGVYAGIDGILDRLGNETPQQRQEERKRRAAAGLSVVGLAVATVTILLAALLRRRRRRLLREVPEQVEHCAAALDGAEAQRAKAQPDLAALQSEAPEEVWRELANQYADSPASLAQRRQELDAFRLRRPQRLGELAGLSHSVKQWQYRVLATGEVFARISTTLEAFRSSQAEARELLATMPAALQAMNARAAAGFSSQEEKLLAAAQETYDKALAASSSHPANWLMIQDLLQDARNCLAIIDDPSQARAAQASRYWPGSETDSVAADLMAAMILAQAASAMDSSGSGAADSGAFDSGSSGGSDFGGFGGGDSGGGGASGDY